MLLDRPSPSLVLLPGLDGTSELFSDLITALGKEVSSIPISYPSNKFLDYVALECLIRTMLPTDQKFFLLAESFSGPIGVSIAASPPPNMLGLILCASFASNPIPAMLFAKPIIPFLPIRWLPTRLLCMFTLGRFSTTHHEKKLKTILDSVHPKVLAMRAQAALGVDNSHLLGKIELPLLYLRAMEDRIVAKNISINIASATQNMTTIDFDAPHFLLQIRPKEAANALADFIKKHTSAIEKPAQAGL